MGSAKTANILPFGSSRGRTPLSADLRPVSRRYRAWRVEAGGTHSLSACITKELGLARGTIEAAYSLLAAEGYIQPCGQAGTIVTPGLKLRMPCCDPRRSSSRG